MARNKHVRYLSPALFLISFFAILIFQTCQQTKEKISAGNGDWRWKNVNDYGKSLHPDRAHVIEIYPGLYMPGKRPLGVGQRLRQFRLVADEYEKLHPDVTIEFLPELRVEGGSEGEGVRTKLLGGIAPEIIQLNTEAIWPDVQQNKGWWVPLDKFMDQPNPYVPGNKRWIDIFRNQPLTQAKRAPDGKMYAIIYDIVETGVYFNKNLFRKLNVSVPQTWREFLQILEKFKKAGDIPLVVDGSASFDWATDLLFDQCYFEVLDSIDYKKSSEIEEAYYQGYLTPEELCWLIKAGYFSHTDLRFRESFRLLKQWRQFWQDDLVNTDRQRLFLTQRTPMFWTASWFVRRLQLDPTISFDWGVFYLPPISKTDSPVCCGVDQCVIGGAGIQYHVTRRAIDDGDLMQTIDFLRFITAPQNAARIINEAGLFLSNIRSIPLAENLKPFEEIVLRRYCTVKWNFSLGHRFTDHRQRMIELFLNGGISLDDFLLNMEKASQRTAVKLIKENKWQAPEFILENQKLPGRRN